MLRRRGHALAAAAAMCLAACTAAPPAATGLMDIAGRPAEKALLNGIRAYEDAQYPIAERELELALATGLASPRDRAEAHKLLAFVYCTSDRPEACEAEFRAARDADPSFALGKGEAGHPLWGPVYRRVLAAPGAPTVLPHNPPSSR